MTTAETDRKIDSSPPERMRAVAVHENRVFGISGDDPEIILVSDVASPEQFRIVDQPSVDEELVGLRNHPLGLILYGRSRTLILLGDGVQSPFRVENLNSELGANNHRAILDALGLNVVLKDAEVLWYVVAALRAGELPVPPWLAASPVTMPRWPSALGWWPSTWPVAIARRSPRQSYSKIP